jgi:N-acetylneuraminate synthase
VAQTGKPLILSTGMANTQEIHDAIGTARSNGCDELVVLHCVSGYPAPASQYNLSTIRNMSRKFNVLTGLSDHTIDNATAVASVALGACVIEKHVTLDRAGGGPDDSFSLEPQELACLCRDTKIAWESIGTVNYSTLDSERGNTKFRRSLYVVSDIKKGETFTLDNIRSIRPGYGLEPKKLGSLIGQRASLDLKRGTPMRLEFINRSLED